MSRQRTSQRGGGLERLTRPLTLVAQVEQLLRQAIADGQFPSGRLPTEVELAEQLAVSRETVRRAAEVLQREGLLHKVRRQGTFLGSPRGPRWQAAASTFLGYLQADYQTGRGQEDAATRTISGLMLQGALAEAGRQGFELVVRHALPAQVSQAFQTLYQSVRLRGIIFASHGPEKLLQRATGLGLPTVLLDHDGHVPGISSIRDDSFTGAGQAVHYLASLGHRRIGFANWDKAELNPWRLRGYRQGLRDRKLPRRRQWEFFVELTDEGARRVVQEFLRPAVRPTALYCFNNTLAQLVVEAFRRQGVQVPGDVSVLGAGGEDVPGLTCLQVDWYQMGKGAIQILIRAPSAPRRRTLEHELCPHTLRLGQTAAAPPPVS